MSERALTGRTALVTGGARGIGRACCQRLAQAGANVAINYRSSEVQAHETVELVQAAGVKAHAIRADVSSPEQVEVMVAEVTNALGPIDVLVNNAARDTRHRLDEWSVAQWDESIATNLRPHFFTAQAVAPDMRALGGGAIINLSSNSYLLGLSGYPTYVTAKAGIMGLTKALARELGPDSIRVNCLIPGWVMTERQKELWVNDADLQECLDQQCLKEAIPVDDMIGPCLFLASNASRMMTGQELIVDGGRL